MKKLNSIKLSGLMLLITLMCGFGQAYAQKATVIKGQVFDQAGSGLPGTSVSVADGKTATSTDKSGRFILKVSGNGTIDVTARFLGFKNQTQSVSLSADTVTVNFYMEDNSTTLNTVVVTATSSLRTQQETPMSITSLSYNKIQQAKFNSTADILRSVPGITAEGGGGEIASNIFVRGLPSGGQYQFTPLQMDGMPIISTMGLNSSAPDVYFRNDLGISNIEFVRGGSSTLYGMGSVAGIINYTSKTGGLTQKTVVESEVASPGRMKLDFNTGGPLNNNNVFYNLTGTYRYDNGPVVTGLPSNGYQLRGNIKKVFDNGSLTLYGQLIDDEVQFFLPYHLTSSRQRPTGWDGKTIMSMQTADVSNLTARTPNGFYQSRGADGASTRGGYLMVALQQGLGNDWKFDAKIRTAKYKHEFNFFGVDGSGRNPMSQSSFGTTVANAAGTNFVYTYANDGTPLNPNSLVLENNMTDRNRPMSEMAGQFNLSKTIRGDKATHNLNFGTFLSRTEAADYNVQIRYLSEFKDQPRILNMSYNLAGNTVKHTVNGVRSVPGYTNKLLTSNKVAGFISDEIVFDKLRIDAGLRIETMHGRVLQEKTASAVNADGISVAWGTGAFDKWNVSATDWAAALGATYPIKENLNLYANLSRGYFFPELRGSRVTYVSGVPAYPVYETERIKQGEVGLKLGSQKLVSTLAFFANQLDNRLNVLFLNQNGAIVEVANVLSSRSSGFEFTYDWAIARNLRVDGGVTYQTSEYTADDSAPTNVGNWLERQPRLMYNFGVGYTNNNFNAGFHTDYFGKRYGNASNLVELDPYSIARIDLGYNFQLANKSTLKLTAGVFNLFNSEGITEGNPRAGNAQANTGDFFVGRPIIPRSYFARMTLSF